MKIKDYKCKCGHDDFFFADKGNQKGIYCTNCGKWLKWADKNEQNLAMMQEPPVTPIREKGEWINHCFSFVNDDEQIVTECHCNKCYGTAYFRTMGGELVGANFCPSCGADMRGGE